MTAVTSTLATLAYCLPLDIAKAIKALKLNVALAALRPWLIGLAVILLNVSVFQIYRSQNSCRRPSALSLTVFELYTVIILSIMVFPQKVAELMTTLP